MAALLLKNVSIIQGNWRNLLANPVLDYFSGAAFGACCVKVGGSEVCVGVWDTAGSERYSAMSPLYYRGAKAAVICYDITNAER